jgi:Fic family protein
MAVLGTWGSNAIAGNHLSLRDVETILLEGRTPGGHPVRDVLETVSHDEVLRGLPGRVEDPLNAAMALELHALVFWRLYADAGRLRKEPVKGRGHPDYIVPMLRDWEDELAERDLTRDDVFDTNAWMHSRFLAIHPFSEGNGRVARLLTGLYLLRHNWPPVQWWPEDGERYEAAIKEGHSGDHAPLVAMIEELMGRSLVLLLDAVGTDDDRLVRMGELERDGPYTAKYLALRASQGQLPAVGKYRMDVGKD